MKSILGALALMIAWGGSLYGQEQTPEALLRAAQCLAAKDFLPTPKATAASFGYLLDDKSYPGAIVLYVVRYAGSDRNHGTVFTVFLTREQGRDVFNIQNNAAFVRTKDGVEFPPPDDPLGGIWTREHLVSAIKRIEGRPHFKIPFARLQPSPLVRCEAYTDVDKPAHH